MRALLETIASITCADQPHDQIINYVNMTVTKAINAETTLNEEEASIKLYINVLEDILHVMRKHPMHRLNKVNPSALYSLEETTQILKLNRQKVIRMINDGTLCAVKDKRKFLPYKWSVDNFMYTSTATSTQISNSIHSTLNHTWEKNSKKFGNNPFLMDDFFK